MKEYKMANSRKLVLILCPPLLDMLRHFHAPRELLWQVSVVEFTSVARVVFTTLIQLPVTSPIFSPIFFCVYLLMFCDVTYIFLCLFYMCFVTSPIFSVFIYLCFVTSSAYVL